MTDADIHAFGPALHAAPDDRPGHAAPKKRRARWPWVLAAALLLTVLLMAALTAALVGAVVDGSHDAVHVVLNGHDVDWHDSSGGLAAAMGVLLTVGLALALGLAVAALAVLFVLPLALGVALFGLAFAVGVAVLSAAGAAALALSPLLVLGGLLWLAFRAGRRRT